MSWGFRFRPYVPVAKRRANGRAHAAKLAKKENRELAAVEIAGRNIASSFWGKAWCDHLEKFSDFANRLPRGRTYVRNGSVIDLQMKPGLVKALVSGSEVYTVTIKIKTVPPAVWSQIKKDCSHSVASLLDLLQGRFDNAIMQRLTQVGTGLFPQPKEIEMNCSCPDWAGMCKHVAATLYGVGARLDSAPELLFTLRDVDHLELISQAATEDNLSRALDGNEANALPVGDLGEIFGIDLEAKADAPAPDVKKPRGNPKPTLRRKAKAEAPVTALKPKKKTVAAKKRKSSARS